MDNEGKAGPSWQISELMTLNQLVGQCPKDGGEEQKIGGPQVRFHIPVYQRLYVWKKDQIERLLNDIRDAWLDGNEDYFIGGALVVERERYDPHFAPLELIDGQQRLTTLLLTGMYRHFDRDSADSPYQTLLKCAGSTGENWEPRLHFEIRDKANTWFREAVEASSLDYALKAGPDEDDDQDGGIAALKAGLNIIEEWFNENRKLISTEDPPGYGEFDEYLLNQVRTLVTSVPAAMDLNHLFETINDRSVQLEHHEVLKARMLNQLKGEKAEIREGTYAACARLWEACSAMDDSWEEALAQAAGRPKTQLFGKLQQDWGVGAVGGNTFSPAAMSGEAAIDFCRPAATEAGESTPEQEATLLKDIIHGSHKDSGGTQGDTGRTQEREREEEDNLRARSLISFPMLLLHTLRIWLHRHGREGADIETFNSLALLDTFREHLLDDQETSLGASERVISFVELLWETRYLLDQHIIRWVELKEGGEWAHQILRLEKNSSGRNENTTLRRSETEQIEDKEFSLLQSMLYHSQDIRQLLWLTPLLGYLHARTFPTTGPARQPNLEPAHQTASDSHGLTAFMRHLDNGLFSTPSLDPNSDTQSTEHSDTLLQRSRAFLEKPWRPFKRPTSGPLDGGFHGSEEIPRTSHYWYYKVDFILWRRYRNGPHSGERGTALPDPNISNEITLEQLERAWLDFRFTARTSVEHIHPQTPQESEPDWPDQEVIDSFGNLALVSRERNSEFTNLPYGEKRSKFITRLQQGDLQSPKLVLVYLYGGVIESNPQGAAGNQGKDWSQPKAKAHLEEVKRCVDDYFQEL